MKTLKEIKKILGEKKPYLKRKYNVRFLGIFGSFARSEETPVSDVDILVDFDKPIGLEFVDLAEELEKILETDVDLVSKDGGKSSYLEEIESDLVYV